MDYLEKLKVLMKQHNLTEYKLAQKADVAQSTINSLFRKNNLPTIPTLESLLIAMDMTLSEFFYDEALMKKHELEEQNLLKTWGLLTKDQKQAILKLIELLLDSSCKN